MKTNGDKKMDHAGGASGASAEQISSFRENGYLILPNVLSKEELVRIRDAADRAEAEWKANTEYAGWRRNNVSLVANIVEYDDLFVDLMTHPKMFPVVRDLVGDDIALLFSDYYITPAKRESHIHWHQDVGVIGPYHPLSTMYVKAFFMLSDVAPDGGPTAILPGSHRYETADLVPQLDDPTQMPGAKLMALPAGSVWLFNARGYHAAMPNRSDAVRRVVVYSYGHCWMKPWQGYEPSENLRSKAETDILKQLFHMTEPYSDTYQQRTRPAIGGTSGRPD